jgi:hypothetical protein
MGYRLQGLLDLRRRGEKDAESGLAAALAERARQEQELARLEASVAAAGERLRAARAAPAEGRAADVLGRERFRARLQDGLRAAEAAVAQHRAGPLAAAAAGEQKARGDLVLARREREAIEQHKEKEEAALRVTAERRAEDAASDLALAAHARKPPSRA